MANRLAQEKSVYLRQHGENPVNWFAWGEDAFALAERERKPVLVSIGYSTCHWCHVMERESFEDQEVARALNESFVAIKVDREELPVVDQFYMEALHLMTERGGWPLNMFVTPDRKPFFGGTYFPKRAFLDVLDQIKKIWSESPERITAQAEELQKHLRREKVTGGALGLDELRAMAPEWRSALQSQLLQQFDARWGGFGQAPKFPRSHGISALMRASEESDDPKPALFAAELTLKAMAYGGMRDHLRGGFHRYSTDERWLVPHFEKMLYDQALLVQSYSEAYRLTRDPFYADIVEETLDFLEGELRLASGGFAAAQDADAEGVEGKSYVWGSEEVTELLGDDPSFMAMHSISAKGNWEGVNVISSPLGSSWEEWKSMRARREKLLARRRCRVQPIRDDKVIVSWNAWMATGLLRASLNLLDRPALSDMLLNSAVRCIEAIDKPSDQANGTRLPRVFYGGEPKGEAYLEDYAALAEALQFLGMRTLDSAPIARARVLLDHCDTVFREGEFLSPVAKGGAKDVPFAHVEEQDGATPSALSVFVGAQLRQALFDADLGRAERAARDVANVRVILDRYPVALSHLLVELEAAKARLIKIPADKGAEFWREWADGSELAGTFLFQPAESKAFEACDFSACYAREESLEAFWRVALTPRKS